jgi:tRNA threonylcarbamoyladenosine biosynthesis protein TsaB
MILAIRTDKPESEIYLLNQEGVEQDKQVWLAHKELSVTILAKTEELIQRNNLNWQNLSGIVVFEGPGSFTGLRIGITVANTIAYANNIPIIACGGDNWILQGLEKLDSQPTDKYAIPEYGGEANITKPRK